jgi:hypothetical protein
MGHLILEIQHTLGIKEIIMKYFKLLFVIVIFFGFLQGQTKNGDWVLSSTKNYNQLTKEAKDKIESELNSMVKTYADSIKKRFESSYYITEENCKNRIDHSAWDRASQGLSSNERAAMKSWYTKTSCDKIKNIGLKIPSRTLSESNADWDNFIEWIGGYANLAKYNNPSVYRGKSGLMTTERRCCKNGQVAEFPVEAFVDKENRGFRTRYFPNSKKLYDALYDKQDLEYDFKIEKKLGTDIVIKENNSFSATIEFNTPSGEENAKKALAFHNLTEEYNSGEKKGVSTISGTYTFPNITAIDMYKMVKYWRISQKRDTTYKGPQIVFKLDKDLGTFNLSIWTLDKKYSDGYAGQAEKYTKVMVSMINDVIKNTPNAFIAPAAPPKTVSVPAKTTLSYRNQLVQFVNAYFGEQNDQNISDTNLDTKLLTFFNENRKKGKNASGWESFRKNDDRKAAGISDDRYSEIKKDLKKRDYEDIISDHIFRTVKGQQLWMELGFPYV